jgi:DNA-binding transcriptional LysR family regulator
VGSPPSFGAYHLVPAIAAFTQQNCEVRISLHLDDGAADLVRDGLDFSLRIASALKDSSNIARLLVRVRQVLVASPEYIRDHGPPQEPKDLVRHNCLVHALKSPTSVWHFGHEPRSVSVKVSGSMMSNFGEALRCAALLGHGISMHPIYMVDDDLRAGRLLTIMPEFEPTGLEIHAVYPERRIPTRVKEFIDFLRKWLPRESKWLTRA